MKGTGMNKKASSLALLTALAMLTPFNQRRMRGIRGPRKLKVNKQRNYQMGGHNGVKEMARRRRQIMSGMLKRENGLQIS
ncbi:MAG: hypothetical protein M0R00_02730 [Candidatus Omnitrophica bacterium]|jgi:hypothetical protein|nr:hypothetical protein [Candidatus Omnitrophota bacterium]